MTVGRMVSMTACALIVAGCGDSDSDSATVAPAKTQAAPPSAATFTDSDVTFTFEYPRSFKQLDQPDKGDALASVTPVPGDKQNAIKVRQMAAQELPFASYVAEIRQQFADELKTEVSQREESSGDLPLGILEWRTAGLHSINYMFAGGGKTWQLECLSRADHRREIEAACKQAIASIEFTR